MALQWIHEGGFPASIQAPPSGGHREAMLADGCASHKALNLQRLLRAFKVEGSGASRSQSRSACAFRTSSYIILSPERLVLAQCWGFPHRQQRLASVTCIVALYCPHICLWRATMPPQQQPRVPSHPYDLRRGPQSVLPLRYMARGK